MFKTRKNKTFSFQVRHYDERKERIENLKKGKKTKIKFTSNTSRGINKSRTLRLFVILTLIITFVYLFLPGLYFAYLVFAISGVASFIQISINRIGWQAEYKKTLTLNEQSSSSRNSKGSCNS